MSKAQIRDILRDVLIEQAPEPPGSGGLHTSTDQWADAVSTVLAEATFAWLMNWVDGDGDLLRARLSREIDLELHIAKRSGYLPPTGNALSKACLREIRETFRRGSIR